MKRTLISLLSLLTACNAMADIYKSVDKDGNVSYEDIQGQDANEFVPPNMNTIPMPKWQPQEEVAAPAAPFRYRSISFVAPAHDQVVQSDNGNVSITLSLKPALRKGHRIDIYMDNTLVIESGRTLEHELKHIDRGTHTLNAVVQSASGKPLIRTGNVTFHLNRHSAFRNRARTGNGTDNRIQPGPQVDTFRPGPIPPAPATQ